MANVTFIPAFEASVGDWRYYICIMKYAQLAREVCFAHELGGNVDLNTLIQRGISGRTEEIRNYLLNSETRFLGAMIVAAWGGEPEFEFLDMADPDRLLEGVDEGFGVLKFDGTQRYFALDGQHRLAAIKEALVVNPDLGKEDICVLLVAHDNSPAGVRRTRTLFSNVNRHAKATTQAENIALDEEDAFAILTRRALTDDPVLSVAGRVKVFIKDPVAGDVRLAGNSVNKTDKKALTTISVLYELLKELSWGLPAAVTSANQRPSDEALDSAYATLTGRLSAILKAADSLPDQLQACDDATSIRAPKGNEAKGHPMMRPVVQKAVTRAVRSLIDQEAASFDELMERLGQFTWRLDAAPWLAVYNEEALKMIPGKDFSDLLFDLLIVHLAPAAKAKVDAARRNFKALRGKAYPISADEMQLS